MKKLFTLTLAALSFALSAEAYRPMAAPQHYSDADKAAYNNAIRLQSGYMNAKMMRKPTAPHQKNYDKARRILDGLRKKYAKK